MKIFNKLKSIVENEITNKTDISQLISKKIKSNSDSNQKFSSTKNVSPAIDKTEYAASDFIAPPKPDGAPDNWEYRMPTAEDKRYTDSFKTDEDLKLREILLFVWWVRTKKIKDYDTDGPIYFSYNYDIDFRITSQKLFDLNYLQIINDGKVTKTESGQALFDKYKDIWLVHRASLILDQAFSYSKKEILNVISKNNYIQDLNTLQAVSKHLNYEIDTFNSHDNYLGITLMDIETSINDLSTLIAKLKESSTTDNQK